MAVAIRSRPQWGARYARGFGPAPLPAKYLFLHHSVTHGTGDAAMRNIEQIGQDRFGGGVSYTFAVDQVGTVFEGHGIERRGAHTRGLNSSARAIVAIGNFDTETPTTLLEESIAQLVAYGHRAGWWPPRLTGGHRDAPGASTACPGQHLYDRIPDINRRVDEILAGHDPDPEEFTMDAAAEQRFDDIDARLARIEQGVLIDIGEGRDDATEDGSLAKVIGSIKGYVKAIALFGRSPAQSEQIRELAAQYDPTTHAKRG